MSLDDNTPFASPFDNPISRSGNGVQNGSTLLTGKDGDLIASGPIASASTGVLLDSADESPDAGEEVNAEEAKDQQTENTVDADGSPKASSGEEQASADMQAETDNVASGAETADDTASRGGDGSQTSAQEGRTTASAWVAQETVELASHQSAGGFEASSAPVWQIEEASARIDPPQSMENGFFGPPPPHEFDQTACACACCPDIQPGPRDDLGAPSVGAPAPATTLETLGIYLSEYNSGSPGNDFWDDFWGSLTPQGFAPNFHWNLTNAGLDAKNGVLTYNVAGSWYDSDGITDDGVDASTKIGAIRNALDVYEDILGINFVETTLTSANDVDIAFGNETSGQAFANFNADGKTTNGNASGIISNAWINIAQNWTGNGTIGDYYFHTALHEIGHTLGLGHQGNYNAGQGSLTYGNQAQWQNDTLQFTMMSYWAQSNYTPAGESTPSGAFLGSVNVIGPQVVDWLALNRMYDPQGYGINDGATTGDTTWGFNDTWGASNAPPVSNTLNNAFNSMSTLLDTNTMAIVDGGGIDTLDMSGFANNTKINIGISSATSTKPALSNVGGLNGNLAIAVGTVIENAIGGAGSEEILGNSVANNLVGNGGNDTISGFDGNDTIIGGSGINSLIGGNGDDIFEFTPGTYSSETISGGAGEDKILLTGAGFWNFDGPALSISSIEELEFNAAGGGIKSAVFTTKELDQTLEVPTDFRVDFNANAADTLTLNIDSVNGLDDFDASGWIIQDFNSADAIIINGDVAANIIGGTTVGDTINGGDGNDSISGNGGDDSLVGGTGIDTLIGGDGNDTMEGEASGSVTGSNMSGGLGDDTFRTRLGSNDTIAGGTGIDTLILTLPGVFIGDRVIDIDQGYSFNGGAFQGTWSGLENVTSAVGMQVELIGNSAANVLIASSQDDVIVGEGGDDTLFGGAGNDTLTGGSGVDVVNGDAGDDLIIMINGGWSIGNTWNGGTGSDTFQSLWNGSIIANLGTGSFNGGGDTLSTLVSIENFIDGTGSSNITGSSGANRIEGLDGDDDIDGGSGNDTLLGGGGNDTLEGGSGVDSVDGGDGDDTILQVNGWTGGDTYNGGAGVDTFDYSGTVGYNAVVNLATGTHTGAGAAITLIAIENVIGNGNNDSITGTVGANLIVGNAGNDTIDGGGGTDTLLGGAGNDVITMGGAAVFADGGAGNDVITSVPGSGQNTLLGGAGDDTITAVNFSGGGRISDGGDGDDLILIVNGNVSGDIEGGAGNDTFDASADIAGAYFVDLAAGTKTDGTISGIENVIGSQTDNTITGDGAANLLDGQDGNDTISGGAGNDTILGGDGNDSIDGVSGVNSINGGAGNDTITGGSSVGDTIFGGAGDDLIIDIDTSGSHFGEAGNDTFRLVDGFYFGDIDGGLDTDTLDFSAITGFSLDANLAAGTYLYASVTYDLISIENVLGGVLGDTIGGSNDANNLRGFGGDDIMRGRDGDDTLTGDAGNDTLNGGGGNDTVNGGGGADRMLGEDGDDLLQGGANGDNISGGLGNDTIDGGADNDRANYADAAGAIFVDLELGIVTGGDGNDILISIERIDGARVFDDTILGSSAGDTMRGLSGDDTIDGRDGDDRLIGDGGNDSLIGGLGDDSLAGNGNDDILDGGAGNDSLSGGNNNDLLLGGVGNDTLLGSNGFDTLIGGSGNDFLAAGNTDDTMTGGLGADTFEFRLGDDNDVITDYVTGTDSLRLDDALWVPTFGVLNAAQVVAFFAVDTGPDVLFDFGPFGGGQSLLLDGVASTAGLAADITII